MQKGNAVNAVVNAVIDSNVLTVDTFNDLAKYCNNTVISYIIAKYNDFCGWRKPFWF